MNCSGNSAASFASMSLIWMQGSDQTLMKATKTGAFVELPITYLSKLRSLTSKTIACLLMGVLCKVLLSLMILSG